LPAALFLVLWLQRRSITWFRLTQIIPFVVLGVGMGLLTVWWEHHLGTRGKLFSLGLPERLLIASHAVWFYAGKLVWPVNLTFSYPRWTINAADPLAYGWLVAGGGLCAAICLARRYVGRSVEVAAVFYVATLIPLLGFFMLYTFLYTFVADHYQYVACIGPMALAAAGITIAFDSFGKATPILKPACCGSLLLLLGLLTWRQCGMYADIETLWRATIDRNPKSWMAYDNLGNVLLGKGQVNEAIGQFEKALEVHPDDAIAHNNLGNALVQKGRLDEAIVQYRKALEINPVYAEAAYNLGNALLQKGLVDEAIAQFRTAMKIYPGFADAHYSLGIALRQKGLVDEGIAQLRMALEIDPENAKVHNNLGTALLQKGLVDEGIVQLRKALEVDPDHANARYNLGIALLQKGQVDEAIVLFRKVVEAEPRFVKAHDYLGIALLQKGRMEEAVVHFQRALAIRPDDADACHNLTSAAWLLATGPAAAGRNGPLAVTLAEQADRFSGGKDPMIIGTLAAAYAEAGRFPEAIAAAGRAQQLAAQQGNTARAEVLGRQVKLYQTGTPFRDTNAPAVSTSPAAP
jgi:tetratricopeptide (TPR) repeat protein